MADGVLVLVGTPLGNRGDLSPRAREAILSADLLLCEDTRSPARLLDEGELPRRISCFVGNEHERVELLLAALEEGKRVAYVSEAGLPVWSDPGRRLVAAAVEAGFAVDVIPGPTAAAVAVCHAGFEGTEVRFVGFLPRSGAARHAALARIAADPAQTVLYEAGNRIPALLTDLAAALHDPDTRRVAVCRELTKLHQEVLRGTAARLAAEQTENLRGEVTLVMEGAAPERETDPRQAAARAVLEALTDPALKPRERARTVADLTGQDAREIYRRLSGDGVKDPS